MGQGEFAGPENQGAAACVDEQVCVGVASELAGAPLLLVPAVQTLHVGTESLAVREPVAVGAGGELYFVMCRAGAVEFPAGELLKPRGILGGALSRGEYENPPQRCSGRERRIRIPNCAGPVY